MSEQNSENNAARPPAAQGTVAIAIMCKTPIPGKSKTRLSPPLCAEDCAAISACFIRDLAHTIKTLEVDGDTRGCAVYTPLGSEVELRELLPASFPLVLQSEGDFGVRLLAGIRDLLALGYAGAILVNSDSPTLPRSILRDAINAVLSGDNVVLSPAMDGGYTLIGLSRVHERLFTEIPWSTEAVYALTLERAAEVGLPVVNVQPWYDVDDETSLKILEREFDEIDPASPFDGLVGADAPASRAFLKTRTVAQS